MEGNIVKLVFQTVAAGSGFADVSRQTSELQKKLGKLSQGAQILGSALGSVGGMFGRSLAMLLRGGIWGAAAEIVKFAIEKTGILKGKSDDLNASLEATRKRLEEIGSVYAKSLNAIDEEIARKKRALEITREQEKAELALAAAKAKASGKKVAASEIAEKAAKLEGDAAKKSDALTVEQTYRKLEAARKAAATARFVVKKDGEKPGLAEGDFDKSAWSKEVRKVGGRIDMALKKAAALEDQYRKTPTFSRKDGGEGAAAAQRLLNDAAQLRKEAEMDREYRKILVESTKAEREIAKNLKKAIQDHRDAVAMSKATVAKAKEAKVNAAIATKDAALEVEREAKRKADEKKAELKTPEKPSAGGTFAEHFELWRDAAAAQEAQDAAKQKTLDLKAFYKAVNRYGGKGRIDEAAALMRSGDDEGLQTRLAEWRKSSKFNGQTEQLVLAAAAKKNEDANRRAIEDIRATGKAIDQKMEAIKRAFEESGE